MAAVLGVGVGFGRAREGQRSPLAPMRGGESENERVVGLGPREYSLLWPRWSTARFEMASFEMWSIACLACESGRGPCSSVIGQLRHSELVLLRRWAADGVEPGLQILELVAVCTW